MKTCMNFLQERVRSMFDKMVFYPSLKEPKRSIQRNLNFIEKIQEDCYLIQNDQLSRALSQDVAQMKIDTFVVLFLFLLNDIVKGK